MIVLDIETLPNISMDAEQKADMVRGKVPSNYKDQAKIDAWIESRADEKWRKTSLDSMAGEILCIGCALDDAEPVAFYGGDCLAAFSAWFEDAVRLEDRYTLTWVGHNISGFDLPWLWRHAVRDGLSVARWIPFRKFSKRVHDTMSMWQGTDYRGPYVKLDDLAAFLGIAGKPDGVDGSRVYSMWLEGRHDEIKAYCLNDVVMTRAAYLMLDGVL